MKRRRVRHTIEADAPFSILFDESTTLSNKTTLILYLLSVFDAESPMFVFFDLVELESQDAKTIYSEIWKCFENHGLSEDFVKKHMVSVATDGASPMVGKNSGVWALMKEKIPNIFLFHCLSHRLELSVGDVRKDVGGTNRFVSFMDKLYSLYSTSPKNTCALWTICSELHLQFLKIGRVLGVRWVSSSFRTVKAVWTWLKYPCSSRCSTVWLVISLVCLRHGDNVNGNAQNNWSSGFQTLWSGSWGRAFVLQTCNVTSFSQFLFLSEPHQNLWLCYV